MKRLLFCILPIVLLMTACSRVGEAPLESAAPVQTTPSATQEPTPEPAAWEWQFGAPENHGTDPEVFARLHDALADSSVYAMVTAKDGVIIDEYYQDGYDENSLFAMHSCSKSFTSALVGIAIEQGYIGGVDDLLADYLPQVYELGNPGKEQITLYHLLTHTSGLEWYEWSGSYSNWNEFQSSPNWVEYILGRNLVSTPGTVFNYSTGNTHLLTAALEAAVGMSAFDYAKENLFGPLGITTAEWGTDPQGITDGGNGIRINARDAARFGQLYLNGGVWEGEQVVPAAWVAESTTAKNNGAGDGVGSYGYQWWTRTFGSGNYNTYYAYGAWGQYIFVVPELNLVTVIASHYPGDNHAPRPYFTDYVLEAVE